MITDDVLTLLSAIEPHPFALVERIGGLSLVEDAPAATPAAYVFVEKDAALENEFVAGGFRQQVIVDVAVVIVTTNVTDAAGGAASAEIDSLRNAVRLGLVGQQGAAMDEALSYVDGSLIRARNGFVWWKLVFTTSETLEAS